MPTKPIFHGDALVVGDNSLAAALSEQLQRDGVTVHRLARVDFDAIDRRLDTVWSNAETPHLFLTTCHDEDALWSVEDPGRFAARRDQALRVPYRICQRWMQRMIDDDMMDRASMVTVVRGGGSLGLSGDVADTPEISNESGGMAGLTKAMLIEAWMRGHQSTPMLVVDALKKTSPEMVVDGIYRELAVPSYDEEVVVSGEQRMTIAGTHAPLDEWSLDQPPTQTRYPLTRGASWVVAGGGRGITAMTAMELAARHDLKLHLLGMAPSPEIDETTREHARRDRADLRRVTMRRVQAAGENPVKHWRKLEKAIEIDLTLDECRRRGIAARYHSVDISDTNAVAETLTKIRLADGPIRGVLQGAGSGQDARFDRKRPEKVDQCLSAKIDGTVSLASATAEDPLEWFVGFGSISGRFGANGHTDYSAANDMLAKLVADLGRRRPRTRCVTFHWHAWGDVGMATKPEAKLALDMIGMKFMPASEGLAHFLGELECGGDASEVLITDRRYVRKFFPLGEDEQPFAAPLLLPAKRKSEIASEACADAFSVTLEPTGDLFLREHLVAGKPTLPLVMATELMAQAAVINELGRGNVDTKLVAINGLRAHAPLKAISDDAFAVEIIRDDGVSQGWTLACDLRRRDGRLVEACRKHFSAAMEFGLSKETPKLGPAVHLRALPVEQQPISYLNEDAAVYHGPALRCLKTIGFTTDPASDAIPIAIGTIVAPSPAHLAGEERPLTGWNTSPATIDAVLYACGVLAGRVGQRASLPISIDRMTLGRLPQPGEPLRVVAKWLSDMPDGSGGILTATLIGQNNDLIAELTGYRVGWL